MPKPYPPIELEYQRAKTEDANPAIQLFGRRFFSDQTVPEFLIEFLLVATSQKKIDQEIIPHEHFFPTIECLHNWPLKKPLEYAPKSRLNLKLFALLGSSKLQTRHQTHRDHYRELLKLIEEHIEVSGGVSKEEVLKTLENLFLGLQRVGGQRTWCAQSFLPICPEMIAGETIWNSTKGKHAQSWQDLTSRFNYFFTSNQHRFLARGGEVLYLQICNALQTSRQNIDAWVQTLNASQNEREIDPVNLRETLSQSLHYALSDCPAKVGALATLIDEGMEHYTSEGTDTVSSGLLRFTKCGWCPGETWKEGYLFAIDMLRLCDAGLDPIERINLMETACAMQVLRTICAQSARYDHTLDNAGSGPLGYVWAISDPDGRSNILKRISHRSVETNLLRIQRALRHPDILANIEKQRIKTQAEGKIWKDPYNEADKRYGHKLFLTLAKRIGFIIPRRGPGARFVLNDHLMRYLVLTIIRPGERMTYDSFVEQAFLRYGIAMGKKYFGKVCESCGAHSPVDMDNATDNWVINMLSAAGVLIHLSDSCSMVVNRLGNGR